LNFLVLGSLTEDLLREENIFI